MVVVAGKRSNCLTFLFIRPKMRGSLLFHAFCQRLYFALFTLKQNVWGYLLFLRIGPIFW
jgi:hypothetical protein